MHEIEPYERWLKYYDASFDQRSPFYGKEYNYDLFEETIYGYYIHPAWDSFGSETLYLKVLYVNYDQQYIIIELMGEWNDAINNDIMLLKRNFLELVMAEGITKFILIGEHLLNFHGSDDCYYEEWFEETEGGWIAAVSFPDFVMTEQGRFHIDHYIHMGGTLNIEQWRTLHPQRLFELVESMICRRLPD
ncbi:MAG: hypothetical protein JST14_15140 [Bacteroidetes bacterium]|nr:hypothetical protein [Bacteroidota bacterium]MBS1977364.1 hypothetical protein [Bacteroidota bacterium]